MNYKKIVSIFISVTALSAIFIYFFYPKSSSLMGLKNMMDKDEIESIAENIAEQVGLETSSLYIQSQLDVDDDLLTQAQETFGIEKTNDMAADDLPIYYWDIRWRKDEDNIVIGEEPDKEKVNQKLFGDIGIKLNTRGRLLEFNTEISDSLNLPVLTKAEAKHLADDFIKKFGLYNNVVSSDDSLEIFENNPDEVSISVDSDKGVKIEDEQTIERTSRTDYQFTYKTTEPYLGNTINILVSVKGDKISRFITRNNIPKEFSDGSVVPGIIVIISYALMILILLVAAFKRIRAYELGFKSAVLIGIIAAVGQLSEILFETQGRFELEMIIGMILGPLMIGFITALVWAVGESMVRETWRDKFIEFDLLSNGYVVHSKIGSGILLGLGFGLVLLVLQSVGGYLIDLIFPVSYNPIDNGDNIIFGGSSGFYLMAVYSHPTLLKASLILTFLGSFIRQKIKSSGWAVVLLAVAWAVMVQGEIHPAFIGIPFEFIFGLLIAYFFFKFNLLSVVIGLFTFSVLNLGTSFIYLENEQMFFGGIVLLGLFLIPVVFAFVSFITKDRITEYEQINPAFSKHITERQRLQSEIEVARKVQMSFLPVSTPDFPGLQIASNCIPAYEVGGDYFDFIKHDEQRLGVVIGDVSGKGTKAAFYMTLTKGFLKALTRSLNSPSEILIQMNNMFYENVDRGNFISMIYGIFDMKNRTFRYSRAGHNPIIYKKAGSDTYKKIQPAGIALGLEMGNIFAKSIEEQHLEINSGDTFVFYTDGFTEAVNKKMEEYGEQRLINVINNNGDDTPDELMKRILNDVQKFTGKTAQRDDMTIIVVKIS